MTNEQLAEIEARLNAATPGPWIDTDSKPTAEGMLIVLAGSDPISTTAREVCVFCDMEECEGEDLRDAKFIANAPADIATLIAEVRRLQADLASTENLATFWSKQYDRVALDYTQLREENERLHGDAMQTDS